MTVLEEVSALSVSTDVKNIAFLVQGLFEISDSIGFDCVYQFREAKRHFEHRGFGSIRLFAERFVPERYPDVEIDGIKEFEDWCFKNPDGIIIYHYCGEWKEIDEKLINRNYPSIVRWHNNTPPWFYMEGDVSNAFHTISGFENIVELLSSEHLYFWVNSEFTGRQFLGLGGRAERYSVVYPASRYLERADSAERVGSGKGESNDTLDILFVGRVVRHKGYEGLIAVAARLMTETDKLVRLHLPGRIDTRMRNHLTSIAADKNVNAQLYGEVSEDELAALYRRADVFLCLSDHEGFGLPVFEAMACGVPVVAWASTAFEELLQGHPFAFKDYDLNVFAAAILSLQHDECRRLILQVQAQIRERYSAAIVLEQMQEALAYIKPGNDAQRLMLRLAASLRAEPAVCKAIAEATVAAHVGSTNTPLARDSGINLYSLYDLNIYSNFIELKSAERREMLNASNGNAQVLLEPREFSWREGTLDNGVLSLPFNSASPTHLFFGPYLQFPEGSFTAEFLISGTSEKEAFAILDVATAGSTFAKKRVRLGKPGKTTMTVLDFDVEVEATVLEFRASVQQGGKGEMVFQGIVIRQRL